MQDKLKISTQDVRAGHLDAGSTVRTSSDGVIGHVGVVC